MATRHAWIFRSLALIVGFTILPFNFLWRLTSEPPEYEVIRRIEQTAPLEQSKGRFLILPGPHKTASSNIQNCMVQWTIDQKLLDDWLWAIPSEEDMLGAYLTPLSPFKRFAPFLSVLRGETRFSRGGVNRTKVLNLHQSYFSAAYRKRRDVVMGAEAMDYIVSPRHEGTQILNGVLSTIPSEFASPQVAVTYRAPRWKHLVSVWHQLGRKNQTLRDFLLTPDFLFMTNSLGLALAFMERNLSTTIIDMEGVLEAGMDMCKVVACEVMNVDCKKLDHVEVPSNFNSKVDRAEQNLSETQLRNIDQAMMKFDCSLRKRIEAFKPRLLYQHGLFRDCPDEEINLTFQDLEQAIVDIVR